MAEVDSPLQKACWASAFLPTPISLPPGILACCISIEAIPFGSSVNPTVQSYPYPMVSVKTYGKCNINPFQSKNSLPVLFKRGIEFPGWLQFWNHPGLSHIPRGWRAVSSHPPHPQPQTLSRSAVGSTGQSKRGSYYFQSSSINLLLPP